MSRESSQPKHKNINIYHEPIEERKQNFNLGKEVKAKLKGEQIRKT